MINDQVSFCLNSFLLPSFRVDGFGMHLHSVPIFNWHWIRQTLHVELVPIVMPFIFTGNNNEIEILPRKCCGFIFKRHANSTEWELAELVLRMLHLAKLDVSHFFQPTQLKWTSAVQSSAAEAAELSMVQLKCPIALTFYFAWKSLKRRYLSPGMGLIHAWHWTLCLSASCKFLPGLVQIRLA